MSAVDTVESPYFHVEYAGVPGVYLPSRSGETPVFSPYDECTGGVAPTWTSC